MNQMIKDCVYMTLSGCLVAGALEMPINVHSKVLYSSCQYFCRLSMIFNHQAPSSSWIFSY